MRSEDIARFADANNDGFVLEPEQRAALIEDVFDSDTKEALALLTEEIRRSYAPTPQRRAENDAELEPIRLAIIARRAELRQRDDSARR